MSIGELYMESLQGGHESLILMLEYLIFEKESLQMDDDVSNLNVFFEKRYEKALNKHLEVFKESRKEEPLSKVFSFHTDKTVYYVAAKRLDDALFYFKQNFGEYEKVEVELLNMDFHHENRFGEMKLTTLKQIVKDLKYLPKYIGEHELFNY